MQKFSESLLDQYDYQLPQKGDIRKGILLELDDYGAVIDIGLKHDGIVSRQDIDNLDADMISDLQLGQEVTAQVMRPVDREGKLKLSLAQVQARKDWEEAQKIFDSNEIWNGTVTGYNRGGLLVKFGRLQAFVPASHLWQWSKQSSQQDSQNKYKDYIDEELPLKLIEINQAENRLIASERLARRQLRDQELEQLLEELQEGQVRKGTVRHLTNFGAFVDLGGADGLIHISELSWERVKHPSEIVQVGDEIEVQILDLDHERQRISLSLKELQPNPWSWADAIFSVDQLVKGKIVNVVDFGAFVELEAGIRGLLHISEIADPEPDHPKEFVQRGDEMVLRILKIDAPNQRLSLSLKRVSEDEREAWLEQQETERAGQQEPEREEQQQEQE